MVENNLGDRLKKAIKTLEFNQKEFCERIGIKQSTLSGIIYGNSPTADTLQNIAKIGINTHWLITGEGEMIVIPKTEKAHEEKPLNISKTMSRKEELILRLMERFSRMDPEKLARWERVIDAMLENEVVETPHSSETQGIEHEK